MSNNDGKAAHHMSNGTGSSAGHLFSVFQTCLMNRTQSSSALLVLIAFCFHKERTNLFNNRRIMHCRFEEPKRLSKHVYQKHTPRPARAHELYAVNTWFHHSEEESSTIPSIPCIPLKTLLQVSAKLQQPITKRKNRCPTHTHAPYTVQ